MELFITCDSHWEAKVEKVIDDLSDNGLENYLSRKDYGDALVEIVIVLMCQDPSLDLKPRIRYSKKEKKLYIDIMLDLEVFKQLDHQQRRSIVIEKLITEVPTTIAKYKFKNFDTLKFKSDLEEWFKKVGLL